MEPYKTTVLEKRPTRCPICGGEVWTILYGEPTAEAYEERFKSKTLFAGCCLTEHEPAWQCYNCHTPFYEGIDSSEKPHMAYATCIISHDDLLPITQTVIHIAHDTLRDRYSARGFIRTYYGNAIDEYSLRIGKEHVRQFFSPTNMDSLKQASQTSELPPILDGATMWLRVERDAKVYIIERNSANVDTDNTMALFLKQMEKLHERWRREEGYGEVL